MNLERYRIVFATGSLVLMFIVAAPSIGLYVSFPRGEPFSEFWILGSNHLAEDYPFNIRVNETYSVFVGVGNHMGVSSLYLIYVKFRNQTQPLPDVTTSQPSPLAPLHEFRAFVANDAAWETLLAFRISEVSHYDNSVVLRRMSINDAVLEVNASATWNLAHKGFYFQLFLELWRLDEMSQSFQYHGRFVGIWLNVTSF